MISEIQSLKKRLDIAEKAIRSIDAVAFDFGHYEEAGRTMRSLADKALYELDNMDDAREDSAASLIEIVEGLKGYMEHGAWVDKKGMRLKDTPEWVRFYVENRR